MKEALTYIFQVSLVLSCGYILYKSVFSRGAFHDTKRFVILFMIAASFVLPVCTVTIHKTIPVTNAAEVFVPVESEVKGFTDAGQVVAARESTAIQRMDIFGIVYFTGVCLLLLYRLIGLNRAKAIVKSAVHKQVHGGTEVLVVPRNITAFSFRNKIVISLSDYSDHYDMIVAHEAVHIGQRHSVDLLFSHIALSLQWFNPFMWLLRRELILVHEFAADRGVISSGIDAKKYKYLLISKGLCGGGLIPVVNHFRSSDLRKRIMTMKYGQSKSAGVKLLLLLPFISAALAGFAKTEYQVPPADPAQEEEPFHKPYRGGNVFSKFGKVIDPETKQEKMHNGIDVIVTNDTLSSPFAGRVVFAQYTEDGGGNKIVIVHDNGIETSYSHLAEFLVEEGSAVAGGQSIGIVGDTGTATGKHLHMECRINGEFVDPGSVMPLDR